MNHSQNKYNPIKIDSINDDRSGLFINCYANVETWNIVSRWIFVEVERMEKAIAKYSTQKDKFVKVKMSVFGLTLCFELAKTLQRLGLCSHLSGKNGAKPQPRELEWNEQWYLWLKRSYTNVNELQYQFLYVTYEHKSKQLNPKFAKGIQSSMDYKTNDRAFSGNENEQKA